MSGARVAVDGFNELYHRFGRNMSILGRSEKTFASYGRHISSFTGDKLPVVLSKEGCGVCCTAVNYSNTKCFLIPAFLQLNPHNTKKMSVQRWTVKISDTKPLVSGNAENERCIRRIICGKYYIFTENK